MPFGVTQEMIDTWGEVIFRLSLNVQSRRGDSVRKLDFEAIEAQRQQTGLSDGEIAARIGLSVPQVRLIRSFEERRRFRLDQHRKLFALGGGKRWRPDRYDDPTVTRAYGEAAMSLRQSLNFRPDRVEDYVSRGLWIDETLPGWLRGHAGKTPNAPALIGPGGTMSYAELNDQATRLAAGLRGGGLAPGEVVAVMLPNTEAFVVTYLAICMAGGVMQTLHMAYRRDDLAFLLDHSGARMAVCLAEMKDFSPARCILDLAGDLAGLDQVITLDKPMEGALHWPKLLEGLAEDPGPGPVGADPFLLLYTSGTTSSPKGVPLTYQNMLSNARLSVPEFGITAEDRILSAAPFTHLYGLYSLHLSLSAGAAAVLLPVFTPPELGKTVEASRPTFLFAGPAHAAACLNLGVMDGHDFSSLRFTVFSGSNCPPAVLKAYGEKAGGGVGQLWGMTETQAGTYTRPGDDPELALRSAGRAAPGNRVAVVDADGEPLPPGEEGELLVDGCSVFPGYLDNPAANAESFNATGWFRTGDLAVLDAEGNLTLTGRAKEIINRGGVKYNPADVENRLLGHPAVAEAAILPYPDDVLGERACLFITVKGGAAPSLEDLCQFLEQAGVAKTKWPERLIVVDEMPMTPTRKIIKGRLRERYLTDAR